MNNQHEKSHESFAFFKSMLNVCLSMMELNINWFHTKQFFIKTNWYVHFAANWCLFAEINRILLFGLSSAKDLNETFDALQTIVDSKLSCKDFYNLLRNSNLIFAYHIVIHVSFFEINRRKQGNQMNFASRPSVNVGKSWCSSCARFDHMA